MAAVNGLEILEERISSLESRAFAIGPGQVDGPCVESLVKIKEEMSEMAVKYTKIGALWTRLTELQQYLTAEFLEKLVLSDNSKADIILADEKQLRSTSAQFEILEKLKDIPGEATFKDLQQWTSKLDPLIQINIKQMQELEDLDEKVCQLLMTYNNIIDSLSRQFQEWEKAVSQLEEAAKEKPQE